MSIFDHRFGPIWADRAIPMTDFFIFLNKNQFMRKLNILAIFLAILAATACHSTKYTPENFPKKQLQFGNGGGFTGQVRTLVLLENGQLFLKDAGATAFSEVSKIKKKKAKAFYRATEELDLAKMAFNHPGNMYQYIELKKDSSSARIVWGDENFQSDQKVKDLYIALSDLLKTEIKR